MNEWLTCTYIEAPPPIDLVAIAVAKEGALRTTACFFERARAKSYREQSARLFCTAISGYICAVQTV